MKYTLTLLTLALSATLVNAQTVDNWTTISGTPVTNSTGLCWRDSNWTPATAHPSCDGATKPAPAKVAAATPASKVDITKPTAVIAVRAAPPMEAKKVSMSTDALFDFDKAVINSEGKGRLDILVEQFKDISIEVAIVVGHTDSVGTKKYNMKLGERRALAVKAFFVAKGVDPKRVYTESKGESQPIVSNNTSAGRATNRRVEIEIIGKTK